MKKSEFIDYIHNRVTINGKVACGVLTDKDIEMVIATAIDKFNFESGFTHQELFFIVDYSIFSTKKFKDSYTLILPENIYSVHSVKEVNNGYGNLGDFNPTALGDKMMAYSMFADSIRGSGDMVMRVSLEAQIDLAKQFLLNEIPFSFNETDNSLVLKRRPKTSIAIKSYVNIEESKVYDNYLFKDYVFAKCRILLGEILSFYDVPMPAGFTLNVSDMVSNAENIIDQIEEKLLGYNPVNIIKFYQ